MTEGSSIRPTLVRRRGPCPSAPRPIVTFGAGSIVGDAHFPAYRKGGFPVLGALRSGPGQGAGAGRDLGRERLCSPRRRRRPAIEAGADLRPRHAAGSAMPRCSPARRDGAVALIQKPMGSDLAEATEILRICREQAAHGRRQFPAALRADDAGAEGRHRQGLAGRGRRLRRLAGARDAVAALAVPAKAAAHRDRHALDPLSRPDPAAARRSAGRACQDDRPSRPRGGADAHQRHPRLWRRRALRAVGQPRPRLRPQATRPASSASAAPRARPILQARRQSRLSARRAGHSGDPSRRAATNGSRCRCRAPGSPTPSSAAWPICSASPPARTPSW